MGKKEREGFFQYPVPIEQSPSFKKALLALKKAKKLLAKRKARP